MTIRAHRLTPDGRRDAFSDMRKLISVSMFGIIACSVPVEQPAEPVETPPSQTAALCHPSKACDQQGPCTCAAGFFCYAGLCIIDNDPWTECNVASDCAKTRLPYADLCWTPVCSAYVSPMGQNERACTWSPKPAGTACKKENGQSGTCGSGATAAECL